MVIVDFLLFWGRNIVSKENEKVINYFILVKEIRKMYGVLIKIMLLVDGYSGVVFGWLFFF